MPELPEVECARRNLARWTAGRTVVDVRLVDPSVVRHDLATAPSRADLVGGATRLAARGRFGAVRRHGKRLGVELGELGVLGHLGMTGRWVQAAADDPPPRFARLAWMLDDGAALWFADARRFGSVTVTARDALGVRLADGHGPDALDALPTPTELSAALGGRAPLKVALMDQARLAGLGNIHAVEALFRAGLSPNRSGAGVPPAAWEALRAAIAAQLAFGIEDATADEIAYLSDGVHVANPFAVYGRSGQPCVRCATPIERAVHGGRSTFWCPLCQPDP